ncbi:Leucine-rich repeat typical subtype [Penicillium malachiteum]|uniref:Leucine-rich repeat typical subtype n=1 Tax=Penicillium malachiteum TaxID=1324776 RepID=UPI00254923AB|nr:Leucine-rich repeat typical subtype [Penicillium malachiteum]KAJ5731085.1 Leucine-rich repeat typical subtype [Penicillium malachiteum]
MEGQPKVNRPPSGIPRPASRLPLPTSTASKSVRPSPSRDRLRADPGLDDRRLRRPSYESLLKKPTTRYSPAKPRAEVLPSQEEQPGEDGANTPDEAGSMIGDDESVSGEIRGRTRPSLSERTIETLAHIPPSPASVQRQSSFFNGASPIRSPSRTPSNVSSYSRSPSRSSSHQTNSSDLLSQPVSKLRLPSRPRMSLASASELSTTVVEALQSPSKLKQPSKRRSLAALSTASGNSAPPKKSIAPPKTSIVRPTPSTASKPSNSNMGPPERPLQVRKTRKPQTDSPSSLRSPSTASRYVSAASSLQDDLTPEQQAESESRKASKSSSALRETIAKAKAARKAVAATEKPNEHLPQAKVAVQTAVESWSNMDDDDPFNQLPKGSSDMVLRQRVGGARSSGTLNIAALSLKEIPQEVITMYEFDPESTSNWFENVDLVKFIAADNELSELPDAVFPDINLEDFDPESDERGPQFGGIEALDLHGNVLHSLPIGLRRLNQLRSLNLSNNAIGMDQLTRIVEITSLVDLKLASNKLEGPLLPALCSLTKLESLDLRGNALTELPSELGELKSLRVLDVGENQLSSLPFEALSKLPLITLNAPKNNLNGTLIPASVDRLEKLQSLNIAHNSIEVFAANNMLSLPSLHSLFLSVNRVTSLPCLSSWQSLLLLSADDNRIAEIPAGFVDLKNLKTADFTGNNITRLDEKLGFMEKLSTLRIANNPLRERKLLTMDTEDIKLDMRNRCEPDPLDTDDEGSVATQFTLAPETPALESGWRIKPGGVLDRSYADLSDLDTHKLELINAQEVRNLYAQHNELRIFPVPALAMLSQTLIELDLSHNAMDSSEYLASSLELPKLQTLNISATRVTTLEPLLANLKAPSLTFIDISNNRLTGALPHIRLIYPEVKTVLASDNQLSRLEFEAVQGLQVLDVSNNDIDSLPSKIGLLGAERSPKNWGVWLCPQTFRGCW